MFKSEQMMFKSEQMMFKSAQMDLKSAQKSKLILPTSNVFNVAIQMCLGLE